MSVSFDAVRRASRLIGVPEDLVGALALTYEEAKGSYSQPEREQVARHLLWWDGDRSHGYQPGSFTDGLMMIWGRADSENKARLAIAFPVYADGKDILKIDGREGLLKWAGLT